MDTLSDKVATSILEDVVAGTFAVGSLLPSEGELATTHGVSRLTIREAIRTLRAQNVVKVNRGLGTEVRPPSDWISLHAMMRMQASERGPGVVDQLLEARRMLEIGSAALAAARRTPEELAAIESAFDRMKAAGEDGDLLAFADEDLHFHAALVQASGNLFLPLLLDAFGPLLAETRRRTSAIPEVRRHAIDHHHRILQAVRDGDTDAARTAMKGHMDQTDSDFSIHVAHAPSEGPLTGLPPEREMKSSDVGQLVASGRRLIVLDDDPTGTQAIADLPVLTSWSDDDLRWAFSQPTAGFFILTNTRSLDPAAAAERVQEVTETCYRIAANLALDIAFASRSDSTLRGHFPLETDVIAEVAVRQGEQIDAVVLAPAYIDARRFTINSHHWVGAADRLVPVADSEFARDATFSFTQSHLAWWVEEKTDGGIRAGDVERLTLVDLRMGGPGLVAERLKVLTGGAVVIADAASDSDLLVLAEAVLLAESSGKRFVYRVGPSFVRARLGQAPAQPLLRDGRFRGKHSHRKGGLIVVGSHVPNTTRQLEILLERREISVVELDVPRLLAGDGDEYLDDLAGTLADEVARGSVVFQTSRLLQRGQGAQDSLEIARTVSAAMSGVVRSVVERTGPSYVIAKGGITSSDIATRLGITRAWVAGTLLPGIVSVWKPIGGIAEGMPFVVFAGNVGGPDTLAVVVEGMES